MEVSVPGRAHHGCCVTYGVRWWRRWQCRTDSATDGGDTTADRPDSDGPDSANEQCREVCDQRDREDSAKRNQVVPDGNAE